MTAEYAAFDNRPVCGSLATFACDVRHFIYTTFTQTAHPPTTTDVAHHFKTSIATIEAIFDELAQAHHIALAPGFHAIWMAHPFSALPTNFVAETGGKRYWGN